MKALRFVLLMAAMYIGMSARAESRPMWHQMDEPVTITVRNIDFFVFPDGQFDFNAHQNSYADYGVRIERDAYGKIRRIGNVYLNYNRSEQVTRIGSIFINYHRGVIRKIGRMRITYSRGGYFIHRYRPYYGYRPIRPGYSYSSTYYGPSTYYQGTYNNTYSYDNTDYYQADGEAYQGDYYYRKNGKSKTKGRRRTVKKIKKNKR